jgi:hypothetical protein
VGTSVASRVLLPPLPEDRGRTFDLQPVSKQALQLGLKTFRLGEWRKKGRRAEEDFLDWLQLSRGAHEGASGLRVNGQWLELKGMRSPTV